MCAVREGAKACEGCVRCEVYAVREGAKACEVCAVREGAKACEGCMRCEVYACNGGGSQLRKAWAICIIGKSGLYRPYITCVE